MEKLRIIYEDQNKIIVFKPAGVLTQSGKSFDADLVSQVLTYRRRKGEDTYAAVINRLDRPVSGLVLFAKNRQEAARLSSLLQKDAFNKLYYAVLCGKPQEEKGFLVDYLLKDGKNNVSKVVSKDTPGAKRAELEYETLEHYSGLTLVRVHLITGRHHQIRVQFASRNLPLLGDTKYGGTKGKQIQEKLQNSTKRPIGRFETALCAYALTVDGKQYETQRPWDLEKLE